MSSKERVLDVRNRIYSLILFKFTGLVPLL